MLEKSLQNITRLKVRFHECDPLQVVWHGHYLKYFEEGREDFGRGHGISYLDAQAEGYLLPVVRSQCEHLLPLRYSDSFEVETTFVDSRAARMTFNYRILKGRQLICRGQTVQVFLNPKGELVLNNPPFFANWKKKMGLPL